MKKLWQMGLRLKVGCIYRLIEAPFVSENGAIKKDQV
jgi:hypothetical protein